MRISLFLLPLLATLCSGITLKFKDCELLEVKGDITIKGPGQENKVTISLEEGKVNDTSQCDQSLVVDLPNVRWTLVFNKQDDTLNQLVRFRPSELFKNESLNSTMLAFDDDDKIELKANTSYICQTPTVRKFGPPNEYQVELNLQSIQVQAFDLPADGKFSPGDHCSEDDSSTTPSTPTKPTTTPSEEPTTTPSKEPTTSPSEEPTSPEAPTTEPPKGVLTFRLKDKDNKTCILMETKLNILLFYKTKSGSAMTEVTVREKGYKVNGTCPEGNAATLEVMFDKNSMRFVFTDNNGQAELKQITATIDMEGFPNATAKTLELQTDNQWTILLGNDKTFFFCNAGQSIPLDGKEEGNASMNVADLKVQAFNFAGQTFNGTGEDCDADKTTSPATPTSTHIPPTPPPADVPNNFTVKDKATNVTCIRVKGVMNLTIAYNTTDKKMENQTVVVPHEFKVGGNCNASATTQVMTVTFFEDWKLEFAFTTNVSTKVQASQVGADPTYFAIDSIKLTYKLDGHFPKPAQSNVTMQAALQVPEGGLKAQMGGSYMCNSDVTFGGSGDVSLKTTSFQYMAFNNNTAADFPDNGVTECSQDLKDNSVVPIAVGAALAALVIIVLIAYLIGRRRSRRSGYESV